MPDTQRAALAELVAAVEFALPMAEAEWTYGGIKCNGTEAIALMKRGLNALAPPWSQPPAAEPVPMPERWVVVHESVLDVGFGDDVRTGGKPELGYALIANAGTFGSEVEAAAALKSASLPLGWVYMPLSRLLPDLYEMARTSPPAAPVVEARGEPAQQRALQAIVEMQEAETQALRAKGIVMFDGWLSKTYMSLLCYSLEVAVLQAEQEVATQAAPVEAQAEPVAPRVAMKTCGSCDTPGACMDYGRCYATPTAIKAQEQGT